MSNKDTKQKLDEFEKKLKELAFTIDKVEDEKLEITNQLKKVLSDYNNLERDIEKRVNIRVLQLKISMAKSLFKSVDDIGYAMKASENLQLNEQAKNWLDGLKSVLSGIEKSLLEIGVEVMVVSVGDEYDSDLHEVVTTIPGNENNKIVDVIEKGYLIGDVVIKPARVVVSRI